MSDHPHAESLPHSRVEERPPVWHETQMEQENHGTQRPVVLWDLDGTILDPAGAITEGIRDALWASGFEAPENLERFVGPPLGESLRRFTDVPEERIPAVISTYRATYLTEGMERTHIYPGVVSILEHLRTSGISQAVATQKPELIAVQVIERFGLSQYFQTISGAADDLAQPVAGKPQLHDKPAIIGEALHRLGIATADPRCTVMIGDRVYDAQGAAFHGLDCVGVRWGFAQHGELDSGFTRVADSPQDLLEILEPYLRVKEG